MFYAGSHRFRAKCLEKPTPPARWEDEASAILDPATGRIDGRAGNVCLLLQSEREKSMQAELVSFGIDLFDLEDEAQRAANISKGKLRLCATDVVRATGQAKVRHGDYTSKWIPRRQPARCGGAALDP